MNFFKIVVCTLLLILLGNCKTTVQTKKNNSKEEIKRTSYKTNGNQLFIDSLVVKKHLYTLASDEMMGRKAGTAGIEKAARYIENEFKKIGLKTYGNLKNYRQTFTFKNARVNKEITTSNIIGVLEGTSKKDEFVVISAHYDHLGIKEKKNVENVVFNGANDNASGVTGMLALAAYYKEKGNERTLVFIAFTAEEMGLAGSNYFGKKIDASKFIAGINLEMIGKKSSFGPKTAWLTGFDRSNFGKIIQKNLVNTDYKLYPDPYKKYYLFFRSDNASLARLGIPAHTFSTSAIDTDADYHKVTDTVETLNLTVVTQTINAVALGINSIVNGYDTPTRIVLK